MENNLNNFERDLQTSPLLVLHSRTILDDYNYCFLPADITEAEKDNISFLKDSVIGNRGGFIFISISQRFDLFCTFLVNSDEDKYGRKINSFVGLLFFRESRSAVQINKILLNSISTELLNQEARHRFPSSGRMPVEPIQSPELSVDQIKQPGVIGETRKLRKDPAKVVLFQSSELSSLINWLKKKMTTFYFYCGPSLPSIFLQERSDIDGPKLKLAQIPSRFSFPMPDVKEIPEETFGLSEEINEELEIEMQIVEKKLVYPSPFTKRLIQWLKARRRR